MFKKIVVLVALAASTMGVTFAQQSNNFNFPIDKFDFGVINEGEQATHTFEFYNTGKDTILLKQENVRASCGCTTPSFSTDAILPGQKGVITASFNSSGRPGVFQKTVTVYYKDEIVKMLNIKGIVEPITAAPAPNQTQAPAPAAHTDGSHAHAPAHVDDKKSAKIVLEKHAVNYGKIERSQKGVYSMKITNAGKDTLFISKSASACSCTSFKLKKEKAVDEITYVLPGKTARLEITYSPAADGYNRDIITLYTNDPANARVSIPLEAEVVESLQQKNMLQEGGNNGGAPFSNK
ncbi:DUF1573 domain-containing protein [Cytophaga aurantiaca]|uniref:DUF1573 domain-containing protein n=1 Tax=Cytophaga aurantiaca TaxID=29530 RepID=UPI00037FC5A3|nr:DUF1573 domain-containing protein [Cytophaga aurantiaca]